MPRLKASTLKGWNGVSAKVTGVRPFGRCGNAAVFKAWEQARLHAVSVKHARNEEWIRASITQQILPTLVRVSWRAYNVLQYASLGKMIKQGPLSAPWSQVQWQHSPTNDSGPALVRALRGRQLP
eukprot:555615-Pyramimonas_sp.AAC.2